MITNLYIKNIALITELQVSFEKGLTILSGETGAGKSIIIDSLSFVLGKRADKSLIRYGEDLAMVSAYFDLAKCPTTKAILKDFDIDQPDDELMLKRSMSVDGKNTCLINGVKVTLNMLKDVASTLVDIYGQHESTSILSNNNHLPLLDSFAGNELVLLKEKQSQLYSKYSAILKDIKVYGNMTDVSKNLDLISYQITEINEAHIVVGEEEELIAERKKMNNAQNIIASIYSSYELIDGEEDGNVLERLSGAISQLRKIGEYGKEIEELGERIESAKIELKDIADTLQSLAEENEFDQAAYDKCDEKITLIHSLKRKYGDSEQAILDYVDELQKKYDFFSEGEANLEKLEKSRKTTFEQLFKSSVELSLLRRKTAKILEKKLVDELKELGMKGCSFLAQFNEMPQMENSERLISANGFDDVVFLFSANTGQPPRELSKIISGGELSRFMLAVKNIISRADDIGCMIFDEIDTGISGKIAQIVAEKLYQISLDRQVLAITHLPQLASMADNHYLIEKSENDKTTATSLKLLNNDEIIQEIARLNGGSENSEFSIPHAKEMKAFANSKKQSLQK